MAKERLTLRWFMMRQDGHNHINPPSFTWGSYDASDADAMLWDRCQDGTSLPSWTDAEDDGFQTPDAAWEYIARFAEVMEYPFSAKDLLGIFLVQKITRIA